MIRLEFPPALMTREIAAYYISRPVRRVDELREKGEITAYPDGKYVMFKKTELDAWIGRLKERQVAA